MLSRALPLALLGKTYFFMWANLKIRRKLILGFLAVVIPFIVIDIYSVYSLNKLAKPLKQDIPASISNISGKSRLDSLAQFIRYYDEVLTQSARNYAFTGDVKWKARYNEEVPKLEANIKEAILLGDQKDRDFFTSVDTANLTLIKMEEEALALVEAGQLSAAVQVLESQAYWDQKEIYKNGLVEYVSRRGLEYDQAMSISTQSLEAITQQSQATVNNNLFLTLFIFLVGLLLAIVLSFFISSALVKPVQILRDTVLAVASGQEKTRVKINSQDEIGQLAESFNKMTDKLQKSKANVEAQVKERTVELEKLNKYMLGRELKMVELKEEVKRLTNK
jgi:HAMP domain-containing protein